MAPQVPRGIRNNNPLNIRKGNNWLGERQPQSDPAFEEFRSIELGVRAGFIILRNYIKRRPPINTISSIISRWAPLSENNTTAYIREVSRRSGLPADQPIKFEEKNKLCRIVQAMCWVECGQEVGFGRIENAYEMSKRSVLLHTSFQLRHQEKAGAGNDVDAGNRISRVRLQRHSISSVAAVRRRLTAAGSGRSPRHSNQASQPRPRGYSSTQVAGHHSSGDVDRGFAF